MKNKLKEGASLLFMLCVTILTGISILAIWDLLPEDVIGKSMATMGIIALALLLVVFAGGFFRRGEEVSAGAEQLTPFETNPIFPFIRKTSVTFIIASVVLLALFGIMSIWEVFPRETLFKSLSSIALIAFSFFIMVLTCMVNEKGKLSGVDSEGKTGSQSQSAGVYLFLGIVLLAWIFASFL